MKIKPTKNRGGVLMELGPNENQLPAEMLFKIRRILVPVDFSECSRKALAYAIPFARQFGADIVVLYVVQPYVPVPEMTAVDFDAILVQSRKAAEGELARLRTAIPTDVAAETLVRVGRPDMEIVMAADELNADLILLSTHGRTGLGRVFLGSVAEHVTRYAHCPVLTVREREHEFVKVPTSAAPTRASNKTSKTTAAL